MIHSGTVARTSPTTTIAGVTSFSAWGGVRISSRLSFRGDAKRRARNPRDDRRRLSVGSGFSLREPRNDMGDSGAHHLTPPGCLVFQKRRMMMHANFLLRAN